MRFCLLFLLCSSITVQAQVRFKPTPIPTVQTTQTTNMSVQNRMTNIQPRQLNTSEPSTKIITPLETDLNEFEKLVMVDINTLNGRTKYWYNMYEERLMSSPLRIINPVKVDKKLFRKNPLFLREVKDSKSIYLYYTRSKGSGNDDINTTVVLRDSNNKILYSASHTNIGIPDILLPLTAF